MTNDKTAMIDAITNLLPQASFPVLEFIYHFMIRV